MWNQPRSAIIIDPRMQAYLTAKRVAPEPQSLVHATRRLVPDLPEVAYFADPSVNFSLTEYLQPMLSPIDAWHHSWLNPIQPLSLLTQAKKFGSAAHCLVLTPEKFTYTLNPKVKQTILPGVLGSAPGGEWELLQRLHEKLLNNVWVAEHLAEIGRQKAFAEISAFTTWEEGGHAVPVKMRHDLLHPEFTIDFKFVREIHPRSFNSMLKRWRYVHRAAWYEAVGQRAGTWGPHQQHWMVFVEKAAPHKILPLRFAPADLDVAHNQNLMAVERFGELFARYGSNPWPDYSKPMTVRRAEDAEPDEFTLQQNWER